MAKRKSAQPMQTSPKSRAGAVRRQRLSSIKRMHALTDEHVAAGEFFHMLWATAHLDGLNAIDYRLQRVDGRRFGMFGLTDRRLWARRRLERINRELGKRDFEVLVIAAGEERSLADVRAWLKCRKTEASQIVKAALDKLSLIGAAFVRPPTDS